MSSDLRDQNLPTANHLVKEYVEKGFVELSKGTEITLKLGTRINQTGSITFDEFPNRVTLQEDYIAKPLILIYSVNGGEIESLHGFYLISEELMRIEFEDRPFVPRMSFDNSRFGNREKMTQQQTDKKEQIALDLTRGFLDVHGIPREVEGNEVLMINLYVE